MNEVIVPVTVTDDKGRFVSDLDQKDFTVYDEGKEQQIQFFTRERSQPVVVGFLIDLSNSSRLHWKNYQDAAVEMVQNLIPGDNPKFSGYLIGYSNTADLLMDTGTDPEPMVQKLQKLKPSGGSALYDSIYMACTSRKLIQGEPIEPRRILVIIGDGHDNSSKKTLDEALEIAQRNLVTIYGVSTVAFGFANAGQQEPGSAGGRDRRPRGISAGRRLQGCGRVPIHALRRRQLRAEGGYRPIRGGDRERDVSCRGSGGRRSDNAVHHPLHSQCHRRQEGSSGTSTSG